MPDHAAGWRQGPDGRWYPPLTQTPGSSRDADVALHDLAALVNSGDVTRDIDALVPDPELAV